MLYYAILCYSIVYCNVLNRHVSRTRPPPECFQRARRARRAGSVTTGVPPKVRAVEPALRSCEHNRRQPCYSTQTLDKTADVNTPTSPGCDHSLLLAPLSCQKHWGASRPPRGSTCGTTSRRNSGVSGSMIQRDPSSSNHTR